MSGEGKIVYVVHGINDPFSNSRSTDYLASRLREDGYTVIEIRYNWIDPISQANAMYEISQIPDGSTVIGHSWGGLLLDVSDFDKSRLNHIDVATVHSDIKGTDDWLFELNPDVTEVEGSGHTIDDNLYNEILTRI